MMALYNDRPLQTTIFYLSQWWSFYTSLTVILILIFLVPADPEKPVPEEEQAGQGSPQLAGSAADEVVSTKPHTASTVTKATSSKPPTSMSKPSTRAKSPPKPQVHGCLVTWVGSWELALRLVAV